MTEYGCDALCVGAHPDDVEIGMGGTVAGMVRQGLRVAIVDLTNGEPTPYGTPELRAEESAAAARVLGVSERRTLTMPNRYLVDSVENRTALAEVIRELRPRMLFTPYPEDAHPDHVAASALCLAARFYGKFTKTGMSGEPHYVPRVYRYMAVHMRIVAEPTFIMDVSADIETKMEALAVYHSQFGANERNRDVLPMMRSFAEMWGRMAGVAYGEPIFALEPVALASIADLA